MTEREWQIEFIEALDELVRDYVRAGKLSNRALLKALKEFAGNWTIDGLASNRPAGSGERR